MVEAEVEVEVEVALAVVVAVAIFAIFLVEVGVVEACVEGRSSHP